MDMFLFVPARLLQFTRPADTVNGCEIVGGIEAAREIALQSARDSFLTFFREYDLNELGCTQTIYEEQLLGDLRCINVTICTPEASNTYSFYLYRKTVRSATQSPRCSVTPINRDESS